MKRYIKTAQLLLLATVATMMSCNYLEIDNPSYATDVFYNTKDGQSKLITDIYSKYRDVYNTGELQYYGTDIYMAITESPNEKMFNGYDITFTSSADIIGGYWTNLYKIIQEANTLLARCTPDIAGSDYDSFVAQGRYFRVLAYYYLVETFGGVPLFVEENNGVISSATRETEENLYSFMINELISIRGALPAKASGVGRLSDTAVEQLLGKLYLTRAYKSFAVATDFGDAADIFDKIITDGNYKLLSQFADVFDQGNQGNDEIIWAIQYGEEEMYSGDGNPQQALFGFNITALRPDWYGKVQEDYSYMQRGYWVNPQVHEWFTDPEIDSRYDETFVREFYVNNSESEDFGKLGLYFPRWNDESGDDNGALELVPFKSGDEYYWYPQSTAISVLEGGSEFMPMLKKFKDTKMTWSGKGTREDIVMRVADTYLLCAEAHLGDGNTSQALARLNDVRRRAAVDSASELEMELDAIDLDVILDERAREMMGEHDRWFDLKRTGKLVERAKKYNIFVQKYDNINENHLLRPIPYDEMSKVQGLTQNDGYSN